MTIPVDDHIMQWWQSPNAFNFDIIESWVVLQFEVVVAAAFGLRRVVVFILLGVPKRGSQTRYASENCQHTKIQIATLPNTGFSPLAERDNSL